MEVIEKKKVWQEDYKKEREWGEEMTRVVEGYTGSAEIECAGRRALGFPCSAGVYSFPRVSLIRKRGDIQILNPASPDLHRVPGASGYMPVFFFPVFPHFLESNFRYMHNFRTQLFPFANLKLH